MIHFDYWFLFLTNSLDLKIIINWNAFSSVSADDVHCRCGSVIVDTVAEFSDPSNDFKESDVTEIVKEEISGAAKENGLEVDPESVSVSGK